jgi:tRNA(His) guanylyltransferase
LRDDLGDRLKSYEAMECGRTFMPLLPVYARLDGRAFSRFTRGMDKPYDIRMSQAMIETTKYLVKETCARIGYTQSDEISLVWQQDDFKSELFFGGKVHKIVSVLASMATVAFNFACAKDNFLHSRAIVMLPEFDCRVFQLPNRTEVANCFLWRERDATRNAILGAAQCVTSHREMQGKDCSELQEMMFQKGFNFNDFPAFFKRGTFVRRVVEERTLTAEELDKIPERHRPTGPVPRSKIVEIEMPPFGQVTNREAVIFDGAEPLLEKAA